MNVARRLEAGWESYADIQNSVWGSNNHSNINVGWGTNITSDEGSTFKQLVQYITALQLSNTRQIANDLRDDLICPITR